MNIHIQPMNSGEESIISTFVANVFNECIAKDFSQEGINTFMNFISPNVIKHRNALNHFLLVAKVEDTIVGIIELRDNCHISLLFTDPGYHRKGIAKQLVDRGIADCLAKNPSLLFLTVNSSPYAIAAYERLGFHLADSEKVMNGMRFTPMKRFIGPIEESHKITPLSPF